jgi:CRP-like cAMP-binding protein
VTSSAPDIAARLQETWLTRDLSPGVRETLAQLGEIVHMPAGSTLTREGDVTANMSFILAGRIALRLRVPERGQVTILTIEPGDVLGWSAIVPPYRATSTAIALADTEMVAFDGPELRLLLASDQQVAAELYPVVLGAVARRLDGTRLQLLDLFSQRWIEPW